MALAIDDEGNFYDDGEGTSGGSTGITYSDNVVSRSAAAEGNAGEAEAASALSEILSLSAETGAATDSVLGLWGGNFGGYTTGSDANATTQGQALTAQGAYLGEQGAEPQSNMSNVIDKLLGNLGKAYEKDPKAFLQLGLGTIGGMYAADEKRKAADAAARGQIDQQNNSAAIEQAKKQAYTNSLKGIKPGKTVVQKPLSRINGAPIYTNGVIKG